MAAAATTLLALGALLAGVGAVNQCTTKTFGYMTSSEVPLQPVSLSPTQTVWRIVSPVDAACAHLPGYAVGVMVTACDPDSPPPPSVQILSLGVSIITRNAYRIFSPANVYVNVYCTPDRYKGTKDAKEVGVAEEVAGVEEVADVGGVVGESRLRARAMRVHH